MATRTYRTALLLLILGIAQTHAQTLPGPASGGWYVIMGKSPEAGGTTRCFANIVATAFKDTIYVEAEALDNVEKQTSVSCAVSSSAPTDEEQKQLQEAQRACASAYDREKIALAARDADPKNSTKTQEHRAAQSAMWKACAFDGDATSKRVSRSHQRCSEARALLESVKQLAATKRFGPYPSAARATDELRAAGWRMGTSPTGNPIWQAESGC